MENLTAARLQMTLSLAFHMVYAPIGIGFPLLMVLVEWLYLRTGKAHYKACASLVNLRDLKRLRCIWLRRTGVTYQVIDKPSWLRHEQ